MTFIQIIGVVLFEIPDKYENKIEHELLRHFKTAVPADQEGTPLEIFYFFNAVFIRGTLKSGTDEIPRLEAWFSNRLATLKGSIKQAVLQAELEEPHRLYIWSRTSAPGIKAVAMELDT